MGRKKKTASPIDYSRAAEALSVAKKLTTKDTPAFNMTGPVLNNASDSPCALSDEQNC